MFTNNDGSGPGQVTPENDKGVVTGQGNNPQNTPNYNAGFKSKIIAAYARIKDAVSGFYLYRGVGLETIAMLIMVAVFGAVRVFQ